MKPTLGVYALPRYLDDEELAGSVAVVIDVLRAATTIAYALQAGAREIAPLREVSDARALAETLPAGCAVLGGERGGLPIDGFQLGNSPAEYVPEIVCGKTVILTTTNGTRAIERVRTAAEVLVASFVNVSAIVARLLRSELHRICIVCAGTDGRISEDDVLLAGLLVERLQRQAGLAYRQNSQAVTARQLWRDSFALPLALGAEPLPAELLAARLRKSLGGINLLELGFDADILAAAQIDLLEVVPRLDAETFRIRRADYAA